MGNWVEKVSADWGNKPVTKHVNGLAALAAAALVAEDPKITPPLQCVPPPSSSMDQLIRKSQVDRLEALNEKLNKQLAEQYSKITHLEAIVADQADRLAQDVALHNELRQRDAMWQEKLAAAEHLIGSQQAVMDTDEQVIREKDEKIEDLEAAVDHMRNLGTMVKNWTERQENEHDEESLPVGLPVEPPPPTRTQSAA